VYIMNNPYSGTDNPYASYTDYYEDSGYSSEAYDEPDLYNLMANYMLGRHQNIPQGQGAWDQEMAGSMGMTEDQWHFLERFAALIPEYKRTAGTFKEKAHRQKMLHSIYEAGAAQSKKVRNAKAESLGQHSKFGKMGFRSGESGQVSKYINDSVKHSSISESAAAMGSRYDYRAKTRDLRTGFVDSLWDLYGDFLASKPERVVLAADHPAYDDRDEMCPGTTTPRYDAQGRDQCG
jgi:hypothetical protein